MRNEVSTQNWSCRTYSKADTTDSKCNWLLTQFLDLVETPLVDLQLALISTPLLFFHLDSCLKCDELFVFQIAKPSYLQLYFHVAFVRNSNSYGNREMGYNRFRYVHDKMRNASRFCVSSLRRGHANLLCIVPILVYVLGIRPAGKRAVGCRGSRFGV